MNNGLQIFENTEFGSIRTLEIDGEPWFIGKEVAEVLEYTNPTKAIRIHCDDEDKLMSKMDTSFGEKDTYLINESGLYSLILRSKLEKAKRFKRWVTSEVLPALRKHGMYVTDDLLNNPDLAIKAFTALKEEREKNKALESELEKKEEKVNTLLEDNSTLLESNNTLLESNEELTTSNKVFVTNVNTWDYKSILNSLVRVYAMTCFSGRFGQAWNDYFTFKRKSKESY